MPNATSNNNAGKVPPAVQPIGYFIDDSGKQVSVRIDHVFWRFFANVAAQFLNFQPQTFVCTQSSFPDLTTIPDNSFIYVSDFSHLIYFDGSVPTFADGGSNYYALGSASPGSVGWHAVDGSTVNYLNADGTLTAKTLVDTVTSPAVMKAGIGTDTLVPTLGTGTEDVLYSRLWFRL